MIEVQKLLREAEIDAEKTSAVIRLIVFLTLLSVILTAEGAEGHAGPVKMTVGLYGVGALIGLILAWRRVFHPSVPYIFVTFDAILISAQILMLAAMMGIGSSGAFALPASGLLFVILIHTSMRYRPWLIVYAACLFLFALAVGNQFNSMSGTGDPPMAMARHGEMASVVNYQVLPFALVALAAIILFVTSRRTRALLLKSIIETRRLAELSRYFSPNLADSLAAGEQDDLLAGRRLAAAVLFVDIRGFTALGEAMTPEELTAFLSEFRKRLTKPIFAQGGTVDKFIGDAVMAVFGTPLQRPDDASRAVACALEIVDVVAQWSEERKHSGQFPVEIGIGVHYGDVFAGALDSEQLLEYTVIGDTVNVAERLEKLSRDVQSPLVVSAALLDAAPRARTTAKWRHLPPRELKGHSQPIDAYCLDAQS